MVADFSRIELRSHLLRDVTTGCSQPSPPNSATVASYHLGKAFAIGIDGLQDLTDFGANSS
ncbi:hypothetical protein TIFTF001_048659 [Ficus carica]|uniref:Uncharacterized protein n=1 Tax=Ficus carica TaxID=3494 RepID=A0AA88CKJ0_FICCA|nr:hypothetical protein TIFTF001_048659 [Ficus carica]